MKNHVFIFHIPRAITFIIFENQPIRWIQMKVENNYMNEKYRIKWIELDETFYTS